MATAAQDRMLNMLPSALRMTAVDLSSRGVREYCFPVPIARQVLEALLEAELPVFGGDLYVREDAEFFAAGEGWYLDSVDEEPFAGRAQRIWSAAGRLFDLYSGAEDKCVTFVV
jgi:hypothetical protein